MALSAACRTRCNYSRAACGTLRTLSAVWDSNLFGNAAQPRFVSRTVSTRATARRKAAPLVNTDDFDRTDDSAKDEALEHVMRQLNGRFGKGSLMMLGSSPQAVETTTSGCLPLDLALGGGYPKGRIVEIFGPESSGKTTLALHAIAEVQKKGGRALFIDAEHAFDNVYAEKLGIDVKRLYFSQPDHGEMALEIADSAIRSSAVDIIVIDSVSALVPRAEIEGEVGLPQVGTQARLMSQAMRKLAPIASKNNCTIIFLNQIRYKVATMYGNPETTSGGQALKFSASQRIDVRKKEALSSGGEPVGIRVRAKIVKNKVAPPGKEAMFDIMFGSGINSMASMFDAAEMAGVVARRGAWYYYGDFKLGQGREKSLAELESKPEMSAEIETAVRKKLAAGEVQLAGAEEGLDVEDEEPPSDL